VGGRAVRRPAVEHSNSGRAPMSFAHCPNCGLTITDAAAVCPLCRASLIRVNMRRVLLWSAVIAEYVLLMLVLHLRR
jgi:ribosomal protein S26